MTTRGTQQIQMYTNKKTKKNTLEISYPKFNWARTLQLAIWAYELTHDPMIKQKEGIKTEEFLPKFRDQYRDLVERDPGLEIDVITGR